MVENVYRQDETKIYANRAGPGKMAEGIAMIRAYESSKPEDERICYDPSAIHFINPKILEYAAKHRDDANAAMDDSTGSIVARVRYFDDFVKKSINDGFEQLVIFGAGFDTRAYRIEELENVKVFEVDHPDTQCFKVQKIKEIFGSIPEHVVYVPVDFESQTLGKELFNGGYNRSLRTLFIMEGLIMYITPESVSETLKYIVGNSGKGSAIIFDYFPESVIKGTNKLKIAQDIRNFAIQQGEPLRFGIKEGELKKFLSKFGFSNIKNVTSEDYKKLYFQGKNEKRNVCELVYFAHAMIE
ncbi:MAG: Leucine carboxyl methyltransferase [Methanobacterium sp. PtaU1.Bin242]|nr:MAG: Leucine carboxyl methyltransferase [Methanobacterium sp. PtaU1.Bin242]